MSIISRVGRKTFRLRCLRLSIYVVLVLGSITTAYPFWLMLSGSIASNHTASEFRLIPRYLYSERGLFEAHIWHKYYRYSGIGDIESQWKVTVPSSLAIYNPWKLVPGKHLDLESPVVKVLVSQFCELPFEGFRQKYEAISSPKNWTSDFENLVSAHYPFAVDTIRTWVRGQDPFELEKHALVRLLELAFKERFVDFMADYDQADQPDPASGEFAKLLKKHQFLAKQPQFLKLLREYWLCRKPDLTDERVQRRVKDYYEFRRTLPISHRDCYWLGGASRTFKGDRQYQEWLKDRYGTLSAINEAYGIDVETWLQLYVPLDNLTRRTMYIESNTVLRDWNEWKSTLEAKYIRPPAMEYHWAMFLHKTYGGELSRLNEAYGSNYLRFFDVPLMMRPPGAATPARKDWEKFVREKLPPRFMRFTGGVSLWRKYLLEHFGSLDLINRKLRRSYKSVEGIMLPYYNEPVVLVEDDPLRYVGYPPTKLENVLLLGFIETHLPAEYISVVTGENLYRMWLLKKYDSVGGINDAYGTHEQYLEGFYYPTAMTDWIELEDSKSKVRWFTFTRAYKSALDQIFRHKRSLWNTAVYCTGVVTLTLLVNPMCAYALSRFNLPGTYTILLFLMATMAFPPAVTMIPNFLLIKYFPLMRILLALAGFLVVGFLCATFTKSKRLVFPFFGAVIGAALGGTIVSDAARHVTGLAGNVPLLNTYWALILPGLVSGYSIFILKGFFDTLPRELYESAVVDGAGEMRIFAQITLPMSKPVLAVIALWSFTAAYGSFTWALIICQDPKMWTLMVHLYQYQMFADGAEQLAALTLASLPVLIVFLMVQKVILKGIIIPVYK